MHANRLNLRNSEKETKKLATALANVQIKYLFVNTTLNICQNRRDPQLTMHNIRDIHFKLHIYIYIYTPYTYTMMCKHIAKLLLSTD